MTAALNAGPKDRFAKLKTWFRNTVWTVSGFLVLGLMLVFYNIDQTIQALEDLYLHHLTIIEKTSEKAEYDAEYRASLQSMKDPSSEGPCKVEIRESPGTTEQQIHSVEQQVASWSACNSKLVDKYFDEQKRAMGERWAIHEKRLRLEVRWDTVNLPEGTEDAKELGWNYPRARWNGNAWSCPVGTSPYSIQSEMQAGAREYVHCLTRAEAAEHAPADFDGQAVQTQKQATVDAQPVETSRVLSKCYALPDQELVPGHPLGRLREACVSLVIDQRIVKPTNICHELGSVENFDSCMSSFTIDDATDACVLMIRDPDLAPACRGVLPQIDAKTKIENHQP